MQVLDRLLPLTDSQYRDFHAKLVPNLPKERFLGVRMPQLRALAKELSKDPEISEFLQDVPHKYQEENLLHGFLIEILAKDFDTALSMVEDFLPYMDNWAVTDCVSPKALAKNFPQLYEKTVEWMHSGKTYRVRYGLVMQLRYFLDDRFRPEILPQIAALPTGDFYIDMAAAWYLSMALLKQPASTLPYFQNHLLSPWVHNKALQKARESKRCSEEEKEKFQMLKYPPRL